MLGRVRLAKERVEVGWAWVGLDLVGSDVGLDVSRFCVRLNYLVNEEGEEG